MDVVEYILMRIFLVLFIGAILIGIRMILTLIKMGWNKLVKSRNGENPAPQVKQPPQPPVVPQPPEPPVVPQPRSVAQTHREEIVTTPIPNPLAVPEFGGWRVVPSYQLRMLSGPLTGRTFPLQLFGSNAEHTFGRHPSSTIRFPAETPGISGNHCRISYENYTGNSVVYLQDCGSTYGTYLENGQRLQPNQPVTLRDGDTFYLAGRNGVAVRLDAESLTMAD